MEFVSYKAHIQDKETSEHLLSEYMKIIDIRTFGTPNISKFENCEIFALTQFPLVFFSENTTKQGR